VLSRIQATGRSILGQSSAQQPKQRRALAAAAEEEEAEAERPPQQQQVPSPEGPAPRASRRQSLSRRGSITRPDEMDKLRSDYNILQEKLSQLRGGNAGASAAAAAAAAAAPKLEPLRSLLTNVQPPPQALLQPPAVKQPSCSEAFDHMDLEAPSALQDDVGDLLLPFHLKFGSSELGRAASELYEDTQYQELCHEAMSAQLQRTKDGATTQSRIVELAGGRRRPAALLLPPCLALPGGGARGRARRDAGPCCWGRSPLGLLRLTAAARAACSAGEEAAPRGQGDHRQD
jgi:hypothetical protein